jgi:hypothetical protein
MTEVQGTCEHPEALQWFRTAAPYSSMIYTQYISMHALTQWLSSNPATDTAVTAAALQCHILVGFGN